MNNESTIYCEQKTWLDKPVVGAGGERRILLSREIPQQYEGTSLLACAWRGTQLEAVGLATGGCAAGTGQGAWRKGKTHSEGGA